MNIREAGWKLRTWQTSSLELVEEALAAADEHSDLNAFITVTAEHARREAQFLDNELRKGHDRGPLHGIPIALKDLFYTRDIRTTGGSKVFADFVPQYDATVVTKLEAAGAICIGKLGMHELAYGITSNNPHYGAVRNPHDHERIPGGSSGGSGAAVASGIVFCGMGSDTGGSIRIPASYCGVVGLKPTFGRVSRYGCMPLGLTLDHMGPLTRTVVDAAMVLEAIAGRDPKDESTVDRLLEPMPQEHHLEGVRIGIPQNFYTERLDPEVAAAYEAAARAAEEAGAQLVQVRAPNPTGLNAVARTILLCEASSVLMPHWDKRADFGEDVLALIDQGRLVPAVDYVNAQRVRQKMIREWTELFRHIDVLFTPTTPIAAPRIGEKTVLIGGDEEDTRLASTKFVRGFNALGFPAISIPCGRTLEGLPIGLQIIAEPWQEIALLDCAAAMEGLLRPAVQAESPEAGEAEASA